MTVETAAIILNLSDSSIRKYITSEKLKADKLGKAYDITHEDLIKFFREVWAPKADLEKFLNNRVKVLSDTAKIEVYDLLSLA